MDPKLRVHSSSHMVGDWVDLKMKLFQPSIVVWEVHCVAIQRHVNGNPNIPSTHSLIACTGTCGTTMLFIPVCLGSLLKTNLVCVADTETTNPNKRYSSVLFHHICFKMRGLFFISGQWTEQCKLFLYAQTAIYTSRATGAQWKYSLVL